MKVILFICMFLFSLGLYHEYDRSKWERENYIRLSHHICKLEMAITEKLKLRDEAIEEKNKKILDLTRSHDELEKYVDELIIKSFAAEEKSQNY